MRERKNWVDKSAKNFFHDKTTLKISAQKVLKDTKSRFFAQKNVRFLIIKTIMNYW